MSYTRGDLRAEGKTKRIWRVVEYPHLCIVESKDDITAGDGAKHDLISGKAALANQTTCNVFELLKRHQIPMAYHEQIDETSFLAEWAQMLPWEVVGRRLAWGSYLHRYPELAQGHRFDDVLIEFFLKTTGKNFGGRALPADDPFAIIQPHDRVELYHPKVPMTQQEPFLVLHGVPGTAHQGSMVRMTQAIFEILEEAWRPLGGQLVDFKLEFGLNDQGHSMLADVVDNDSWRVLDANGQHIDKQAYRNGEGLADVTKKYRYVAELTGQFAR